MLRQPKMIFSTKFTACYINFTIILAGFITIPSFVSNASFIIVNPVVTEIASSLSLIKENKGAIFLQSEIQREIN